MIHKKVVFHKKKLIQRQNLIPSSQKKNVLTTIKFFLEILSKKQWNSKKILKIPPNQSKPT